MATITPELLQEYVQIVVKKLDPHAKVEIVPRPDRAISSIQRISVKTHLFGADVQINLGENVTMLVNDAPVEIWKYTVLANSQLYKAIELWFNKIETYLEKKEIPIVKHFASKYLGQEISVIKKEHYVKITYDKFFVVISSTLAVMCLNSNGTTVHHKEWKDEKDLEKFFSVGHYAAKQIRAGQYDKL